MVAKGQRRRMAAVVDVEDRRGRRLVATATAAE